MTDLLHRNTWGMRGPIGRPLGHPVQTVFVHHTVTQATAWPQHDARVVNEIGIQRFGRMSYSYLLHPDGTLLEGQGVNEGVHTGGYNHVSLGLALIGNYDTQPVTPAQIASACWLLWALRKFNAVTPRPLILPHRSVKATACPGANAVGTILPFMREVAGRPDWRPA